MSGPIPHWIGIVAPTLGDAATSCYAGPAGIRHFDPSALLKQKPGGLLVEWPNGSQAKLFGAREPDDVERLRSGGNTCLVWVEELAAFRYGQEAFDQFRFGLRVGSHPKWIGSTTPKPRPLIKKLSTGGYKGVITTHATMYDNVHLPAHIKDALEEAYAGTTLGSQELLGNLVEQADNALWTRDMIERNRLAIAPDMQKVEIGVDPSGGSGEQGIVVVGGLTVIEEGKSLKHGYTLADLSVRMSPDGWGRTAIQAAQDWDADCVVVEVNFGGDMAVSTLVTAAEALGISVPIRTVRASRGKQPRAQPVSAMAAQNRWHWVGTFPELEDEQCFPAGVRVTTSRGQVPIENVHTGDLVLTRAGWRPVTWSGATGITTELTTVHVQDDIMVSCTPNHPIYLPESDKFVSARNVKVGDCLKIRCGSESMDHQSFGEDAGGVAMKRDITSTAEENYSIVQHGKHITDQLVRPYLSTTSILTPQTTELKTSRQLLQLGMSKSMEVVPRCVVAPLSVAPEESRGRSGDVRNGNERSLSNLPALSVERYSSRSEHEHCGVKRMVLAVDSVIVPPTLVYNLSVLGQEEFFANDILVHNCTWTIDADWSPNRIDACFTAGTAILTEQGERPIEFILPGELVWTRAGWKEVLNSGMTNPAAIVGTVTLDSGRTLQGTGTHPILVDGGRWSWLRGLNYEHKLYGYDDSFAYPIEVTKTFEESIERAAVYNLEVAEQPEYVANGVVVHNCVWPAWHMKLVSTIFKTVGSFGGSQMTARTLGKRRPA